MSSSDIQEAPHSNSPSLEIKRLYVKEQTCKVFATRHVFTQEWKPDIQLEIDVKHEAFENHEYEVILQINITAKNQQRTAFTVYIEQAGLFKITHLTDEQLQQVLKGHCATILYPYARKVVADITLNASFPPLVLLPINFEGLQQTQDTPDTQASQSLQKDAPSVQTPGVETLQ